MKPSLLLSALSLLAAGSALGDVKPGTNSPFALQLTLYVDGAANARYSNREVLTAMSTYHDPTDTANPTSTILDGGIKGWYLTRFTNDKNVGNIYAVKIGKPAVLVPASILTQPVIVGQASPAAPAPTTPPAPTSNVVNSHVSGTITVEGGTGAFSGVESEKTTGIKVGLTSYPVIARTEVYNVSGALTNKTTVYIGTWTVRQSTPLELSKFFPDAGTEP